MGLNPKPRDLTDPEFQKSRTDSALTAVITNGKGVMPGFKNQLSESQIQSLVKFIRTLAEKKK